MFKKPVIIILLNTLVTLGALGVVVYTQVLYQRPKITEGQERKRITERETEEKSLAGERGIVSIDDINVNIKPSTEMINGVKKETEHFARFTLSLELKDIQKQALFDKVKPIFMDELIAHMSKKSFDALTSVQGRYLLRNELVAMGNKLIEEPILMNAYFSEFIVQ